jgi:hypothetical protein
MLERIKAAVGELLARYLQKQTGYYIAFSVTRPERLRRNLRPGDVLLVEGDLRVSVAIKYLTRSTWSHAAFYVGSHAGRNELIEADLREGVRYQSLSKYEHLNTRICRPVGLNTQDLEKVIDFMVGSVGKTYDLKNVIDLLRYLLPEPPVPARWRRRLLALGSGDPTRAICSTLIAQAFQSVRYPILPDLESGHDRGAKIEILHIRHHSLFTPRDFDLSPYFNIVKPTLEDGFDYRSLTWGDQPQTAQSQPIDSNDNKTRQTP